MKSRGAGAPDRELRGARAELLDATRRASGRAVGPGRFPRRRRRSARFRDRGHLRGTRLGVTADRAGQVEAWYWALAAPDEPFLAETLDTLHALRSESGASFQGNLARARTPVRQVSGSEVFALLDARTTRRTHPATTPFHGLRTQDAKLERRITFHLERAAAWFPHPGSGPALGDVLSGLSGPRVGRKGPTRGAQRIARSRTCSALRERGADYPFKGRAAARPTIRWWDLQRPGVPDATCRPPLFRPLRRPRGLRPAPRAHLSPRTAGATVRSRSRRRHGQHRPACPGES